jgi:hypothetical protein
MGYMIVQGLLLSDVDNGPYLRQLLYGFIPYLLFYLLFRNQSQTSKHVPLLIMAIFILPGLIHLAIMYLDIVTAIQKGTVLFTSTSTMGLLEYLKDVPRVGRRYLSVAMLHLLCGGLMMSIFFRLRLARYCAYMIVSLSVISLGLLDARAAYVSLIIGGGLMAFAARPKRAQWALRSFIPIGFGLKLMLVGLLFVAMTVGYSAGKSRWIAMSYSLQAAAHDVFDANMELAQRPYVNAEYWSAIVDEEAINRCRQLGEFRCKSDQSAYLRFAWLLEGINSAYIHPLGIGYSENYMGRLWGVAGDEKKYQRTDSFLVEQIVSFGLPGVAFYVLLVYGLLRKFRHAISLSKANIVLVLVCGLILVCIGRTLIDVFSEGLWRYMMALFGIFFGILNSKDRFFRG